jgi:outer membrane protein OmpA-like peptidoglycan-associated protein
MSGARFDDWADDDEGGSSRRRIALIAGTVIAALALAWLVVVPALRDDGGEAVSIPTDPVAAPSGAVDESGPTTIEGSVATATTADVTEAASRRTSTRRSTSTTDPSARTVPETTSEGSDVADSTPTSASVASSPVTPGSAPAQATYPTLPDGTPQPVIAIFDVDTITLSGFVPSRAAADRLKTLAIANSKYPAAVVEFLAIDPNVPESVPVRVLELTSARFPEGSAEVLGDHARELDRVATVMNALPNVTVLVVGHADQRGSDIENFRLSEDRARAVVSYLVSQGIAPDRLSSRAVGESDLITLGDDDAALALNRRTEFVFSGLLIGA